MTARDPAADARSDRRTMIVGISVMLGLIVFGLAFGARFGATECRRLEPQVIATPPGTATGPLVGDAARDLLIARIGADALDALVAEHGAIDLVLGLPVDGLRRLAPDPVGVKVLGGAALLVERDGTVLAGATFGDDIEVVGSGVAVYALVVGNVITGQVDALRPLQLTRQGVTTSACVDTSAVGSPLSFMLDARDGLFVGLRTDEDGSESVLELRDRTRGRVWAPPLELGQAPAGLHGARTSGAISGDVVVLARRVHEGDGPVAALMAFDRRSGEEGWTVTGSVLRDALRAAGTPLAAALADAPTLRLEVVAPSHAMEPGGQAGGRDAGQADELRVLVVRDVAPDALLPPPLHGPFADLVAADVRAERETVVDAEGAVTLVVSLADGVLREVVEGRAERDAGTVLRTAEGVWVLLVEDEEHDGVLVRLGG
jgi:hypothetical protein